jgi:hypothetical protein
MTEMWTHRDFSFDNLLQPGRAFKTPHDVVNDDDLTINEKRAILASWASDAAASPDSPTLRQTPDGSLVEFDDILDALKQLDGERSSSVNYSKLAERAARIKQLFKPLPSGRSIFVAGETL